MADSQDILDALESIHREEQRPVATSTEIAERVDVERRRVLQLLDALEAVDAVDSAKVARGRAFWSTDTVRIAPPADPSAAPPAETPAEVSSETPAETPAENSAAAPSLGEVRGVVRDLDSLPGSGDLREERVDAVMAVLEEIAEAGELKASQIRSRVYEEHPAGYTKGQDPPRSWWKNAIGPALSELQERDVVTLADRHNGVWKLQD